ncbi:hypothetical protein FVEG_17271 [Fusarium verticillioides 7600]|uniref:Uncharacterized protein n=1 Tax=Gibberella moniliformis (strain M3125 / FGSC 7600) TaxID=334819 RepID=W7NCE5_GIBM7|nr:hypothetical protein FVEG_17271 [Fusarium verticillioides 7600]EWG54172.1 hypothetical protein FVEG_17271 [Fusarium verticillioides 7600]
MPTEPYLNAVTVLERFMPYELGRQRQRFHDDHPGSLPMLTDKDWEWIRDVCTKPPTQPGEERYPAEWVNSAEPIKHFLPRWRRYMRYKHPYKGYRFGYRRRFKRNKNQDPRLKTDDNPEPEGQKSRQDENTGMNQDAGSEVAREADSEQEGVGQ